MNALALVGRAGDTAGDSHQRCQACEFEREASKVQLLRGVACYRTGGDRKQDMVSNGGTGATEARTYVG